MSFRNIYVCERLEGVRFELQGYDRTTKIISRKSYSQTQTVSIMFQLFLLLFNKMLIQFHANCIGLN